MVPTENRLNRLQRFHATTSSTKQFVAQMNDVTHQLITQSINQSINRSADQNTFILYGVMNESEKHDSRN